MRKLLIGLLSLFALSAAAQTNNTRKFADGPAKWLMTPEEQRAWRAVKSDAQAEEFIDLFWAKRDPSPGTPLNENRMLFESRVRYADENFKEGSRRGSLSERGRVFILLGAPREMGSEAEKRTGQFSDVQQSGLSDPTGGRALAARAVWTWTHEQAVKFNMPKLEVVFIFDMNDGGAHRDPQRTDFSMVLPAAIKSWIVSPQLKDVPEWADSKIKRAKSNVVEIEETVTGPDSITKTTKRVVIDAPPVAALPAGIGDLVLLNDSMALQPQSGIDPLATATAVAQFRRDRELGWATQYCSGQILTNAPTVKVQLKITAPNGDSFSSDPEEFVPDSIKAAPGCYLLRGSLPLADLDPGPYKLNVSITGASAAQSYNLTHDFQIEQ